MCKKIKPYLKWAGSKRLSLKKMIPYLPKNISDLIYCEPFIGGGTLFFNIKPKNAIINDLNYSLMLTYNIIKNDIENLFIELDILKQNHNKEFYYYIRNIERTEKYFDINDIKKAARMIYLNKTCFNGLYRTNKNGYFNVPFNKCEKFEYDKQNMINISKYLNENNIQIFNTDFETIMNKADEKCFIYLDPPYFDQFTQYNSNGFNLDDQIRLHDIAVKLTDKNVKIMINNSDTQFIHDLYNEKCFKKILIPIRRMIGSNISSRKIVNELLIINY